MMLKTWFLPWLLIGLLGCMIALPETMAAPVQSTTRDSTGFTCRYVKGRKYYRLADIAQRLQLRVVKVNSTAYELSGKAGRMVFTPDKRFGSFNGTVLNYDFEPVMYGGELFISQADFFNHVQVLFNPASLRTIGIRTIIIDPGHGGNDKGASGISNTEKAITLQIALRLQRILSQMGYRVLLTRVNDTRVELSDRARACNAAKADLFVSIHMNAATNKSVRGIETFALTAPGAPSSGNTQVQYNQYPGNAAAHNSFFLAWNVQSALIRATGGSDRGVKQARFVVLRETRCPSILVECGFISNAAEERLLASEAYQEKIATAIARGIYDYHMKLRRR